MVEISPEIKELIETETIVIATSDAQGKPNAIPVACVKVVSKDQLLITDNYMVQTRENLKENQKVCLVVWNDEGGYKIVGAAEYFDKGEWKSKVEKMPENEGLPSKGAILVEINQIIELR
jgi:hypothetical protein